MENMSAQGADRVTETAEAREHRLRQRREQKTAAYTEADKNSISWGLVYRTRLCCLD